MGSKETVETVGAVNRMTRGEAAQRSTEMSEQKTDGLLNDQLDAERGASGAMSAPVSPPEYATEAQIELFDRLRSGDDPVHEEARAELVALADETLELLYDRRVDKADFDPSVRRVLWRLSVLAGTNDPEQFYLTLDGRAGGVDLSAVKVEADANLTEDEQLIRTLLATGGVELVESFKDTDPLCGGQEYTVYAFATCDPLLAEEYEFVSEFADEEVQS